jgi:hypothetical protein
VIYELFLKIILKTNKLLVIHHYIYNMLIRYISLSLVIKNIISIRLYMLYKNAKNMTIFFCMVCEHIFYLEELNTSDL